MLNRRVYNEIQSPNNGQPIDAEIVGRRQSPAHSTQFGLAWGLFSAGDVACVVFLIMSLYSTVALGREFHVSPTGSDDAAGAATAPFRTLSRAQEAAREAVKTAADDIVVSIAAGVYRLEAPLEFDARDSGRNGHRVAYRSASGPGKARLVGSKPLSGWQKQSGKIWKLSLPAAMVFHTMYENGRRVHKARFPNYQPHAGMPSALGRYLVSESGSPELQPGEKTGWIVYRPGDDPPITTVTQMKIAVFPWGKCDWQRYNFLVKDIDTSSRRLRFDTLGSRTEVLARARYFLEDELAFLDAPGEFYLDEAAHTLYYIPLGSGHPDDLNITAPVVKTLIRISGDSRERCVESLCFEGLTLEETDDLSPVGAWWDQGFGARDFALFWMRNTAGIEIRNCHLRNSGRSGIMMIGHNTGNFVEGCWIEGMGVNGVTLANRFPRPASKAKAADTCERNRIRNCRIHDVGQLHIYAACVNVFNASDNEIGFCELYDSARYAVTVRGNTNAQHVTPHTFTRLPPTKGNRIHHLRIYRCGHDSGDMGALHTATLNIPEGDCINSFEQITIADTQAIPSMQDIPPDGIFLDWPSKSMHQVFRHVEIVRAQGRQIRGNGQENVDSATTENVSWEPGFREELMDYANIGLTAEFPQDFGASPTPAAAPPAPGKLVASARTYDGVELSWQPPKHAFVEQPRYFVYRDGKKTAVTGKTKFTDHGLTELTDYRYEVAVADGEFAALSSRTEVCEVRTPADLTVPVVERSVIRSRANRIRVLFSKPVEHQSATQPDNYVIEPPLELRSPRLITPTCVEFDVVGLDERTAYKIAARNIVDTTSTRNSVEPNRPIPVRRDSGGVIYAMAQTADGGLLDASGNGRDARLHGAGVIDPTGGPHGDAALVLLQAQGYAEAPADLEVGAGDFTLSAWIWKAVPSNTTILSKGNGFGRPNQWSWGWEKDGVPGSISLRINNVYFATAADAVPLYRWVHVAFVRRGNTGQCYVDGRPSGDAHDMSAIGSLANDEPLRIGRRAHEANPAYFRGKIGRVSIQPVALTAEQIRREAAATPNDATKVTR